MARPGRLPGGRAVAALATTAAGAAAGLDAQIALLTAILVIMLLAERRWAPEDRADHDDTDHDDPITDAITTRQEKPMKLLHSGKVRDLYADGDELIMVASDRMSVYDVVLPTPVPDKGAILTQLSLWWFERLRDIVPNHVISAPRVPAEWAGRAIRCRRLDMIKVECIARGYLAGLGLQSYRESGAISGVALPAGLAEGAALPEPVFTPTTKADLGEHDEFMDLGEVARQVGAAAAAQLRELTLAVYGRGQPDRAGPRGHHRRHQARVRPRRGRHHHPGRRGPDPGLLPVLAGRPVAAGRRAAVPGQAVRPRLVDEPGVGQAAARPAHAGRRGRGHPGAHTSRPTSRSPARAGADRAPGAELAGFAADTPVVAGYPSDSTVESFDYFT